MLPDAEIRYTVDGSDPTQNSTRYTGPVRLPVDASGVQVTARVYTRDGRASPPRAATFTRTTYRSADMPAAVQPGLRAEYYDAAIRSVRSIDTLRAARTSTIPTVGLGGERAERYALRLTGYLDVPDDGLYEFALTSDDGSSLQVGDRVVVNNDGLHGDEERTGMIALRRGLHPVTVRYFQGGGGASLSLRYRRGGADWLPVPDDWFRHASTSR
jgi:hexosaminidase